jgi:MEMO1 family protein
MNRLATFESARIRPAAAAGRFYPREADELRRLIGVLMANAAAVAGPAPKALIAPHAGYIYSGPIAASAYARLIPARDIIKRIVLVGPSHFVAFEGVAASSAEAFATPLGNVPVDAAAVRKVAALAQVAILDEAHAAEHAIEVQLPFLQTVLGDFSIIPLVTGEIDADDLAEVLNVLWGGPETCLVISSDLSHYFDFETARRFDLTTAAAIESLRCDLIGEEQACGRIPICGLLEAARARHLRIRTVDLRSSGDTAGSRDQVVGYGAFAFEENKERPGN